MTTISAASDFAKNTGTRFHPGRHALAGAIAAALFAAAVSVLHRELAHVHFADVVTAFYAVPASALALALLCAAGSFAAMTGYDMLALRHLGKPLPYASVAPVAFIATVVGQNVGMAVISGGAIRYRMYSALGLGAVDIATLSSSPRAQWPRRNRRFILPPQSRRCR